MIFMTRVLWNFTCACVSSHYLSIKYMAVVEALKIDLAVTAAKEKENYLPEVFIVKVPFCCKT